MRDLTEIDIQILQYIEKRGTADIASIKKKFPNTSAIEYLSLIHISIPLFAIAYFSGSGIMQTPTPC